MLQKNRRKKYLLRKVNMYIDLEARIDDRYEIQKCYPIQTIAKYTEFRDVNHSDVEYNKIYILIVAYGI